MYSKYGKMHMWLFQNLYKVKYCFYLSDGKTLPYRDISEYYSTLKIHPENISKTEIGKYTSTEFDNAQLPEMGLKYTDASVVFINKTARSFHGRASFIKADGYCDFIVRGGTYAKLMGIIDMELNDKGEFILQDITIYNPIMISHSCHKIFIETDAKEICYKELWISSEVNKKLKYLNDVVVNTNFPNQNLVLFRGIFDQNILFKTELQSAHEQ